MIALDKPATDINEWHTHFAGLAYACAQADHSEAADLLRQGWRLLGDPPACWHRSIIVTLDALEFEAMLGAGAEDAAAVAMLQDWAGFMLSHGPGGGYMATVVVEDLAGEASADGASVALALLGATARALSGDELAGHDLSGHEPLGIQSKPQTQRDRSLRLN